MLSLSDIEALGYTNAKVLNDGRIGCIAKFMFTCAIVTVTPATAHICYDDRWCYHSHDAATAALEKWDGTGEPDGWHRHPLTGRRRPNGDPLQEYINH